MAMNRDASFLVPWHNNIPCGEPTNSFQQTGYEHHPPWSMPFGGVLKEEEDDRAAGTSASKISHSQAEKRRRDRINAHLATLRKLIPKSDKRQKSYRSRKFDAHKVYVESSPFAQSGTYLIVPHQTAITKDNVSISIDGVLYAKIVDPPLAAYGVENPLYAVIQLAQTTMRSELGKITLDKTFEERDAQNEKIMMDKAALLGSVIEHVKDLKRKASEMSKFITVPTEVDEITVECYSSSDQDGLIRSVDAGKRKEKIFVRASICCDERPGLFAELKQALRGLKLSTVRADIACLGGRIKSILVLCTNESEEGVWINNITASLKGVLSRIVCSSTAGSGYYSVKSKRQRFLMPSQ